MAALTARLARLEAAAPRDIGATPAQRQAMLAVVSDPEALAMAERLRVLRRGRGPLTREELAAVPGLAPLAARLRAQAEGCDSWP